MVWADWAYVNNPTDLHLLCIDALNNFSPECSERYDMLQILSLHWTQIIYSLKSGLPSYQKTVQHSQNEFKARALWPRLATFAQLRRRVGQGRIVSLNAARRWGGGQLLMREGPLPSGACLTSEHIQTHPRPICLGDDAPGRANRTKERRLFELHLAQK